jgi:hypothetical protein
VEKGVRKGKPTPKAIIVGTHQPLGIIPGTTTTLTNILATLHITANGTHPQKGKDTARTRVKWTTIREWILKFTGVIFTNDMAIRQNGALRTLTAQVVRLLETMLMDCGVRLAIVLAILLAIAMHPLFVFQRIKAKENDRATQVNMAIANGKVRTFPQITTQTKLFRPFMTNLRLPLPKLGGRITS